MRKKFSIIICLHILGGIIIVMPSPAKKSKMIKSLKVITIKESSLKCTVPPNFTTQSSKPPSLSSSSRNQPQYSEKKITNNKPLSASLTPSKKIEKPVTKQKNVPSHTITHPSTSTINNKKLLELTQQSLKHIKGMETDFSQEKEIPLPSSIDFKSSSLNKPMAQEKLENSYVEQLMLILKNQIILPALGDTVVSLVISPQGKLLNISFDISENPENEAYLKVNLPLLSFPVNHGLSKNLNPIKVKIRLISENLIAIS